MIKNGLIETLKVTMQKITYYESIIVFRHNGENYRCWV